MNIYGVEKIWQYLHDNPHVVHSNEYVTNTYRYAINLLDMLNKHPEWINILIQRMELERLSDSNFFLKMRNGYGKTEYRIVKLTSIKGIGYNFKKLFPELFKEEESVELKKK